MSTFAHSLFHIDVCDHEIDSRGLCGDGGVGCPHPRKIRSAHACDMFLQQQVCIYRLSQHDFEAPSIQNGDGSDRYPFSRNAPLPSFPALLKTTFQRKTPRLRDPESDGETGGETDVQPAGQVGVFHWHPASSCRAPTYCM